MKTPNNDFNFESDVMYVPSTPSAEAMYVKKTHENAILFPIASKRCISPALSTNDSNGKTVMRCNFTNSIEEETKDKMN